MITIRPVSDLRNRFAEIEKIVQNGNPVYLTKNGYGTMVVMSMEQYAALSEDVEIKLNEADRMAKETTVRYDADEVFGRVRARIRDNEKL